MNTGIQTEAGVLVSKSGRVSARRSGLRPAGATAASAEKKTAAAKPSAAPSSKASQASRSPAHPSETASKPDKLVCRYCGSDDLAPSFKKRHDARCRACFKQRYGSAARGKKQSRGSRVTAMK